MPKPIQYTCVRCPLEGSTVVLRSDFFYKINGELIPVLKNVGICYNCNEIVPVELLPDVNLQKYNSTITEKVEKLTHALSERTSPPRCLKCGGTDFDIIPEIEFKKDNKLPVRTGLKHRGCGGRIYADIAESNLNYRDTLGCQYYYDMEGNLISTE